MADVLVMANDSLLADLIISNLAEETSLDVLRLTYRDSHKVDNVLREHCLVVIIIEEPGSNPGLITANALLQDYGCFRMITISPEKNHLRICDSYQMPVSGMAQVINLAKGFNRENWSEATG